MGATLGADHNPDDAGNGDEAGDYPEKSAGSWINRQSDSQSRSENRNNLPGIIRQLEHVQQFS